MTPLPDPLEKAHWYGEFWIRYPLSQEPVATKNGHLFKARSEFAILINDISANLFGGSGNEDTLNIHLNENIAKLMEWYDGLPTSLQPSHIVFPAQFKLQ